MSLGIAPPSTVDRAPAYMISSAFCLAAMSTMAHALGPRVPWLASALVRAVVMFASAAAMATAAGAKLHVWHPRTLWVRSLAGSFSLVCNFYALTRLPVSDAVTLMSMQPLWIVLITSVAFRKAPKGGEALGVACGLAGVYLIERPYFEGDRVAALVALLSSVSSAVALLGLHRLRHLDSRAVVAHFAGVAALVSAGGMIATREPLSATISDPTTWLLLAGVGLLGTLGQVLLTRAYAAGVPTRVSVLGLTQVVFAMAFDVALWGRPFTAWTIAGFVLVLAPSAWLGVRFARGTDAGADRPE